jgi:pyruvate kinase
MMDRIITEVEHDPLYPSMLDAQHELPLHTPGDAICAALRDVAQTIAAVATVTYTSSGHTSLRAARQRPMAPILSITPKLSTARRLALVWGVHSAVSPDVDSVDEVVRAACSIAVGQGLANSGEQLAIAAGMPFGESGTTNLLRIARV